MARVNKCIDLIEQGIPIFVTSIDPIDLSYDAGMEMAGTWADMIGVDFEHYPFNVVGLAKFMKGLKDGGPTASGHPTPTVIPTLPSNCISPEEVIYNAWQVRQVLSAGVHGILHTHARSPEAVRAFVATTRFSFQTIGLDEGLREGLRGAGGQLYPAEMWGISPEEYVRAADPWPLNPNGELMLGLKIEDRHCLPNADQIAGTPGICFGEWGPGDMGYSYGDPEAHDPPYSEVMDNARNIVIKACKKAGLTFFASWEDVSMTEEEKIRAAMELTGSMIIRTSDPDAAARVRSDMGRKMPV